MTLSREPTPPEPTIAAPAPEDPAPAIRFLDRDHSILAFNERVLDWALKMNALTDQPMMLALARAGRRGAKIDLIVRGACMLPARVAGVTDNIRARSIIGRFLEHSRVFYFRIGQEEQLFLSSADWMNRNMLRRVELAWPVSDPHLRQRIVDECLVACLHDDRDAWDLMPDGSYKRAKGAGEPKAHGAQAALMERYAAPRGQERQRWT